MCHLDDSADDLIEYGLTHLPAFGRGSEAHGLEEGVGGGGDCAGARGQGDGAVRVLQAMAGEHADDAGVARRPQDGSQAGSMYCLDELIHGKARSADQSPERPPRHFPMIGHRQGCRMARLYQDHVAAPLTRDLPAQAHKHADHLPATQDGKRGHPTAISTSRVATLRGMPRSALTARHSLIASLMFSSASDSVLP